MTKVWTGRLKNLGHWDGERNMVINFDGPKFFFNYFFQWRSNLNHVTATKVWTGRLKNLGHWDGERNMVINFYGPNFFFNYFFQWWLNLSRVTVTKVWTGRLKNLGHWDGDQNQINSFKSFFKNSIFSFFLVTEFRLRDCN